jgi:hypothetical protein
MGEERDSPLTLQEMVLHMTFFVDVLRNRHEIILYVLVIVRMIQL